MEPPSPSSTTVARKRSKSLRGEALYPSFSDLPSSLLEVIISRVVLKDNIRASAVCKSWCEAAVSVRVVEKHPWLMCFNELDSLVELRDTFQSKLYTLNQPDLAKSAVCSSRDGWLLMHRSSSKDMFFLNPFSRERLNLPKFGLPFQAIAFSGPPTSDDCVLIALDFVTTVRERMIRISTCHPGATEWVTEDFPTLLPFNMDSKLFYLNDRFYCFAVGGGYLYSFHPSSRAWICHQGAYAYHQLPGEWDKEYSFLAEKNGELVLMFTCGNKKPLVYKLVSSKWEKMTSTELDGFTILFSSYNSELITDLPWMRYNLWFSRRVGDKRKRCVSYTYDKNRYNPPKKSLNWLELDPRKKSLWIDPPDNVLDYL